MQTWLDSGVEGLFIIPFVFKNVQGNVLSAAWERSVLIVFLSVGYFCFRDDSDDAVGRVLIKPVDDVKLGQVINMLEGTSEK